MRRLFAAFVCVVVFASAAEAQPKNKALTFRWFGQSFFQLETGDGLCRYHLPAVSASAGQARLGPLACERSAR